MKSHVFPIGCSVANGTLCTVGHVVDIKLGSILHFNRTAAELKQCLFLLTFTLSIAENENNAISENATDARFHYQIGLEFDQ